MGGCRGWCQPQQGAGWALWPLRELLLGPGKRLHPALKHTSPVEPKLQRKPPGPPTRPARGAAGGPSPGWGWGPPYPGHGEGCCAPTSWPQKPPDPPLPQGPAQGHWAHFPSPDGCQGLSPFSSRVALGTKPQRPRAPAKPLPVTALPGCTHPCCR